jgi:hypothetical protein
MEKHNWYTKKRKFNGLSFKETIDNIFTLGLSQRQNELKKITNKIDKRMNKIIKILDKYEEQWKI